jgi:hypothetical protein
MSLLLAVMMSAVTLGVPGRSNANASIATDGPTVVMVWTAATAAGPADVYLAVSTNGAKTFAAPVRVNDAPGDARVSGEQPPRVALEPRRGETPAIVVVWTTKGASATRIVEARSVDGGRTFSRAAAIPGGDAAGNRGWEALAAAGGGADALWLDHRDMAAAHEGHMSPQQSKIYFAALDGSIAPHAITAGVCYCCKTALAAEPDGSVYAAWRHVYPGNLRDIAFSRSQDGGRTFTPPIRVSEDHWMLDGCPDDGPAMVVDAKHRVHIVWPTLVQGAGAGGEPTIALFYATSADGRVFTERQRLPTEGLPHHPQIAINHEGALTIAWDELKDGTRRAAAVKATVNAEGRASFAPVALPASAPALYPVVAAMPDGAVVAWTSGAPATSTIAVVRVP